jgi:hypothetical protein
MFIFRWKVEGGRWKVEGGRWKYVGRISGPPRNPAFVGGEWQEHDASS